MFIMMFFLNKYSSCKYKFLVIGKQDTILVGMVELKRLKGIRSILLLKYGWKNNCSRKKLENHLRSNNFEVCTSVVRCFPNILDVIVLENVNSSSDRIGRPPSSN
jgi:hypothetical protein